MKNLFLINFVILFYVNCFSQTVQSYLDSASMVRVVGDTMKIHYLNKAIKLQPNNPELYLERAYAKEYTRTKYNNGLDHEGAINDLSIAIKLNPKNEVYYERRAYNNFMISNRKEAIVDMSKAIEIAPNNAEYYNSRGQYKEREEDFYGALNDYSKAIELEPKVCYHYKFRGNLYFDLEKFEKANLDYSTGINLAKKKDCFPNEIQEKMFLSELYKNRALCKYILEDLYGCISDCNTLLKISKDFTLLSTYKEDAFIYIGLSKIELGKKEEGCLSLSKAGELGSENAFEYIKEFCK